MGRHEYPHMPGQGSGCRRSTFTALGAVLGLVAAVLVAVWPGGAKADEPSVSWMCGHGTAEVYNNLGYLWWYQSPNLMFNSSSTWDWFCVKPSKYSGQQYMQDMTYVGQQCVTYDSTGGLGQFYIATCGQYPAAQSFSFTSVSAGYEVFSYQAGKCMVGGVENHYVYAYACADSPNRTWKLSFNGVAAWGATTGAPTITCVLSNFEKVC